jgi:hypothetical protein
MTSTHAFKVFLTQNPTDEEKDALFECHAHVCIFGADCGIPVVEFDIEADNQHDALMIGIRDLSKVGLTYTQISLVNTTIDNSKGITQA